MSYDSNLNAKSTGEKKKFILLQRYRENLVPLTFILGLAQQDEKVDNENIF